MNALIRYDKACQAIAEAKSVDEVKNIRDLAAAQKAYAKQARNKDLECDAIEIRERATRRLGELIDQQKKTVGLNQGAIKGKTGLKSNPVLDPRPTLISAGIDKNLANQARRLAVLTHDAFERHLARLRNKAVDKTVNSSRTAEARQAKEDAAKSTLYREITIGSPSIIIGDFREKSSDLTDECAELVFIDPPYDRESLPLYEDAARIAARILKPGGSLISYCGQVILPAALTSMQAHLRYWWLNACLHGDSGKARMQKYGIVNDWKPMLWFVKGTRGDVQVFVSDVVSAGTEKSHHEWQQAESEAAYYIEKLTSPNGLVVDFFGGGGTTCVAAEKLGRPWIAFELDPETAQRADERLREAIA